MFLLFIGIFVFTFGLSLWAQWKVSSTYRHYLTIPTRSGYTGSEVAARILQAAGIDDVDIVEQPGPLTDHYDPMNKRLVLSSDNYHGNSLSAVGVSAHECGHAIQHKIAYAPLHWRMAAVGITNFANTVVTILPLIGLFTGFIHNVGLMAMIMATAWGVIMAFNLVTLPVEFDASRRAKLILNKMSFIHGEEEEQGVNKVLNAAGWTYVAAFITSLIYFLWHLLPLLTRRDD